MESEIAKIASLLGEPVRAKILWSLLDGRAYTATELALFADASPQTTSMHLSKLVHADFLTVERQGRHRYYRFANDEVAFAIEAMANLVKPNKISVAADEEKYPPIKYCRSCYDHLAGKIGVAVTESLISKGVISYVKTQYKFLEKGENFLTELGIEIEILKGSKRPLVRPCLDWSERKLHVAGALGASLLSHLISDDWVRRVKNSRALVITSKGEQNLYKFFHVEC
jgi:DNA-binding transcriptional ArsR family regulator